MTLKISPTTKTPESKPVKLPFLDHLEELRVRLIISLIAVVVASCFFYPFSNEFLAFLMKPMERLYFTSPGEALVATFSITLLGGFCLASPFLFYQVWQFVALGLKPNERRHLLFYAPWSLVLFLAGVLFAYVYVLPLMLKFFLSFASETIVPLITVSQYISFVGTLCLSFGIIFELPLAIHFLTKIGIATPTFLIQKRRHAIVAIFIVSAVLTPPDYVSQILMAIPMMALYELGILFSKWTYGRKA